MASATSPRKRGFDIHACAKKLAPEPTQKIPRAADIKITPPGTMRDDVPLPLSLLERLGNPPVTVGFDIEVLRPCMQGTLGERRESAPLV